MEVFMKLFNSLAKKIAGAVALVAVVAGLTGVAIAGFGPERQTFTLANPATFVTFNSITDNVAVMGGTGDERAFSTGAIDGASNWSDPVVNAKSGNEVTIRAYVHNNAHADLNLVAENVSFKVELPSAMGQVHQVKSTISSSNATPTSVFDTLDISAEQGYFSQLEYIPGSARFTNNSFVNGVALNDSIVTSGVTLGYDQLNGKIPGCLNFSGWVTLKVRVKVPAYQVAKTARLDGEGADKWRESVNTTPGQKVEYRIEFINNGATALKDIRIYDKLPTYMKVVPGSVILVDGANPSTNPYVFGPDAVTENGTRIDVLLSNSYPANSSAFIRFKAEVVENDTTKCGTIKFTNIAYAQPGQFGVVNDGADAYLVTNKKCEEPETPVYSCTGVKVEKLGGRKIKTTVTYNGTPANRVVFKNIEYNFGDGSTPLVSTSNPVEYTFAKDGTYKVTAKVTFAVDGVNKTVTSDACASVVTFGTTVTPPKELPYTGAGSNIALFLATTMVGMFIFRAIALKRS